MWKLFRKNPALVKKPTSFTEAGTPICIKINETVNVEDLIHANLKTGRMQISKESE